jgi:wyosine [tRNA(Phe)-imidazoG37] synthetase (radical SAM superfamily)
VYRFLYGPVNSRRLGKSLGISPIPFKTCNMSCIYCQLGRTKKYTVKPQSFFDKNDIISELKDYKEKELMSDLPDWITIVGDGEPLLYKDLGEIISFLQNNFDVPISLITNGSLLGDNDIAAKVMDVNMIMPSLDAGNEEDFIKINRPHPSIRFKEFVDGLIKFRERYRGIFSVEIMVLKDINDSDAKIEELLKILERLQPDEVFVNTPYRPTTSNMAKPVTMDRLKAIKNYISKEFRLRDGSYKIKKINTENLTDIEELVNICRRHPVRIIEIQDFLKKTNIKVEELSSVRHLRLLTFNGEKFVSYRA